MSEPTRDLPATASLIERAGLDRDDVHKEIVRGLAGADDGELFMEIPAVRRAGVRQWSSQAGHLRHRRRVSVFAL